MVKYTNPFYAFLLFPSAPPASQPNSPPLSFNFFFFSSPASAPPTPQYKPHFPQPYSDSAQGRIQSPTEHSESLIPKPNCLDLIFLFIPFPSPSQNTLQSPLLPVIQLNSEIQRPTEHNERLIAPSSDPNFPSSIRSLSRFASGSLGRAEFAFQIARCRDAVPRVPKRVKWCVPCLFLFFSLLSFLSSLLPPLPEVLSGSWLLTVT